MRDIGIQRGYVLSDNYCDTHGFHYVLDFELEHFERLGGEEVWDYHIEPEGGC